MANTFDLETKIPRAFKALIQTLGGPDVVGNIYAGLDENTDRQLPCTTIASMEEGFSMGDPGNYRFPKIALTFRDAAIAQPGDADAEADPNDPLVSAQERFTAVMGLLMESDDATTLDYTRRQLNAAGRALAVDPTNGQNAVAVQSALDNADMVDFTIIFIWEGDLGSHRKVDTEHGGATYYERVLTFEMVACNANID